MSIMEHVNGHGQRGRVVPALPEHTFKDSGITIRIRKIGPTTQQRIAQAIVKEMVEPQVPTVETDLGKEANPADPAYIAARDEWEKETNREMIRRLMLVAALEAEIAIDDRAKADIARKKRSLELADVPWVPDPRHTPDEDERVFYILHVAAATPDDLKEFGDAVRNRSLPTEEAVQSQIATFQRDLPE